MSKPPDLKYGDIYLHRRNRGEYIVLGLALLKVFWWWLGPVVVYRSALQPSAVYVRFRRNFEKRFEREPEWPRK